MKGKLIVGLGNPEKRFDLTRHNIGFTLLNALAQHYKATYGIVKTKKHPAIKIRQKVIHNHIILFLKPMDWMNSSGVSVGRVVRATKIDPSDVMLIHDDMDFDFGDYKIKASGNSGRHNGVQSVIDAIGKSFTRFRVGIGRPVDETARDYVLSKFNIHEQKCFCELIGLATQVVDSFIVHGSQKTMNTFNRKS